MGLVSATAKGSKAFYDSFDFYKLPSDLMKRCGESLRKTTLKIDYAIVVLIYAKFIIIIVY